MGGGGGDDKRSQGTKDPGAGGMTLDSSRAGRQGPPRRRSEEIEI